MKNIEKLIKLVSKIFPNSEIVKDNEITPSQAGRVLSKISKQKNKKKEVDKNTDQLRLF